MKKLVYALAEVWNMFLDLPKEHEDDITEFRHNLHDLQNKILARSGRREL